MTIFSGTHTLLTETSRISSVPGYGNPSVGPQIDRLLPHTLLTETSRISSVPGYGNPSVGPQIDRLLRVPGFAAGEPFEEKLTLSRIVPGGSQRAGNCAFFSPTPRNRSSRFLPKKATHPPRRKKIAHFFRQPLEIGRPVFSPRKLLILPGERRRG
ncbi:hypothetical protein QE152_g25787 [Popillia japonica]|uniref:Uncharacterized protein n=1 Tax=Popillia japonica TaxID=7064 RepID=A0AAW1K0C1_POPJA